MAGRFSCRKITLPAASPSAMASCLFCSCSTFSTYSTFQLSSYNLQLTTYNFFIHAAKRQLSARYGFAGGKDILASPSYHRARRELERVIERVVKSSFSHSPGGDGQKSAEGLGKPVCSGPPRCREFPLAAFAP